jgi:hypothetical protein
MPQDEPLDELELPQISNHLPGQGRHWSGRTNITIWLDRDVIDACGERPASGLRIWIETHHPATRRKYQRSPSKKRLTNLQRYRERRYEELGAQAELEEPPITWVPVPPAKQKGQKPKVRT